jgi:hypothetical protein
MNEIFDIKDFTFLSYLKKLLILEIIFIFLWMCFFESNNVGNKIIIKIGLTKKTIEKTFSRFFFLTFIALIILIFTIKWFDLDNKHFKNKFNSLIKFCETHATQDNYQCLTSHEYRIQTLKNSPIVSEKVEEMSARHKKNMTEAKNLYLNTPQNIKQTGYLDNTDYIFMIPPSTSFHREYSSPLDADDIRYLTMEQFMEELKWKRMGFDSGIDKELMAVKPFMSRRDEYDFGLLTDNEFANVATICQWGCQAAINGVTERSDEFEKRVHVKSYKILEPDISSPDPIYNFNFNNMNNSFVCELKKIETGIKREINMLKPDQHNKEIVININKSLKHIKINNDNRPFLYQC